MVTPFMSYPLPVSVTLFMGYNAVWTLSEISVILKAEIISIIDYY